jgi:hypothetical protein
MRKVSTCVDYRTDEECSQGLRGYRLVEVTVRNGQGVRGSRSNGAGGGVEGNKKGRDDGTRESGKGEPNLVRNVPEGLFLQKKK